MKSINILSLTQAYDAIDSGVFNKLTEYHGIEIKPKELLDLSALVSRMSDEKFPALSFDGFYIGFKIPQIGKEFDLLRFGVDSIINIELKQSATEEKIKLQLLKNRYYLKFTGRTVHNFTFVSDSSTLYRLSDDSSLEMVAFEALKSLLSNHVVDQSGNVERIFDPSDYLISPFNSTDRFLNGEYFLTHQQEEFRVRITSEIKKEYGVKFFSITGAAGTGKTLLTYDLVRNLQRDGVSCLVIHCGLLNDGHDELKSRGWSIEPIKNFSKCSLGEFSLVVVDEAQRLQANQLKEIIEEILKSGGCCIFSYDRRQTLRQEEARRAIHSKITEIKSILPFDLSEKIRSNKEIASFIKGLFDSKANVQTSTGGNISLSYFSSVEDASKHICSLDSHYWRILKFTPSRFTKEYHNKYSNIGWRTSHEVIGQEFDWVVVVIDKYFDYREDGGLFYNNSSYYSPDMMLFQNITRARKKLHVVIMENEKILDRCLKILR